jgi:hypothetical protein
VKQLKLIKVIRLGQAVQELAVEDGTTVGTLLSQNGIDASGRTLTFNGAAVTVDSPLLEDGNLLLAAQTKGGM